MVAARDGYHFGEGERCAPVYRPLGVLHVNENGAALKLKGMSRLLRAMSVIAVASSCVTSLDVGELRQAMGGCDGGTIPFGFVASARVPITSNAPYTTADLNRDGLDDLLVPRTFLHEVVIFMNPGDGGALELVASVATTIGPTQIAVADLNADGEFDLVLSGESSVAVLWGADAGHVFSGAQLTPAGGSANGVVVADFNSDGVADVASASLSGDGIFIALNPGDGGPLVPWGVVDAGSATLGQSADFNRDGRDDAQLSWHCRVAGKC